MAEKTIEQACADYLNTAGALLDKARSTPFTAEQEALAFRAYSQLAKYLNALDPGGGGSARRRERRLLRDRRQGTRGAQSTASSAGRADAEQTAGKAVRGAGRAIAGSGRPNPYHHGGDLRPRPVGGRLDAAL